jgi:hypothetical protein
MYLRHDRLVSDAVRSIAGRTRCGVFPSDALRVAIQADRNREIERATRERRLLMAADEVPADAPVRSFVPGPSVQSSQPAPRGGSMCESA